MLGPELLTLYVLHCWAIFHSVALQPQPPVIPQQDTSGLFASAACRSEDISGTSSPSAYSSRLFVPVKACSRQSVHFFGARQLRVAGNAAVALLWTHLQQSPQLAGEAAAHTLVLLLWVGSRTGRQPGVRASSRLGCCSPSPAYSRLVLI